MCVCACALQYVPLKGHPVSNIFDDWMLHNDLRLNADPAERTDRIARREAEQLQQQALAPQTQTPRAIRPAEFFFDGTGSGRVEQTQGTIHDVDGLERRDASPQVDVGDASETNNPLHAHPADI
eukprot:COSAG02_NODE_83_length_39665_cov_25.213719_15_plen_124_part_00